MIPILIDTNAYAALKRGDKEAEEIVERAPAVGLSLIVLGEVLTGIGLGRSGERNLQELERFLSSPGVRIVPIDEAIARHYARLNIAMRKLGKPIPTNDLWIAATALEQSFDVFTYDAHFRDVPGLRVIAKLSDLE